METPRMGLLLSYMFLAPIETPRMGLLCNENRKPRSSRWAGNNGNPSKGSVCLIHIQQVPSNQSKPLEWVFWSAVVVTEHTPSVRMLYVGV